MGELAFRLADADFDWHLRESDVMYNAIGPEGYEALWGRFGDAVKGLRPPGSW